MRPQRLPAEIPCDVRVKGQAQGWVGGKGPGSSTAAVARMTDIDVTPSQSTRLKANSPESCGVSIFSNYSFNETLTKGQLGLGCYMKGEKRGGLLNLRHIYS